MPALQHITVIDLTHMLSGPYGAMLLSDMGARTIKVEPPGRGEGTRELLRDDPQYSRGGDGAYFLTLNRNKQSVAIDLKHEAGRAVFLDLVRQADVVIDNFSPGVTQRLGIDPEALAAVNPAIVTCSITGFGETGPDVNRPAFDQVVQAMGGGMSITGLPDGPPVRSGIPIGDLGGGLFGALGVLAALQARSVSGKGRHVDISMLDCQISMLNYMATMYFMSGEVPGRIGNSHFVHVPYNTFATADGYLIIACIGDAFYQRLSQMLGRPELQNPAWQKQAGRLPAKNEIEAIVAEEMQRLSTAEWLQRLREARVPCGPVNDFAAALSDPQVLARNMVRATPLPTGEQLPMPGNPVKFSNHPEPPPSPAPKLGEHTDAVLSSLPGYDADRLAQLRAQGAIG